MISPPGHAGEERLLLLVGAEAQDRRAHLHADARETAGPAPVELLLDDARLPGATSRRRRTPAATWARATAGRPASSRTAGRTPTARGLPRSPTGSPRTRAVAPRRARRRNLAAECLELRRRREGDIHARPSVLAPAGRREARCP